MKHRNGFSLVRLIVIIALIAIALMIGFIVWNPAQRIRRQRNDQRTADVTTILRAIQDYKKKNGTLPSAIDADQTTVQIIGTNPGNCDAISCPGHDLPARNCALTDLGKTLLPFLNRLPTDPKNGSESDTRYFINRNVRDTIIVGACNPESEDLSDDSRPPPIEVMWW